MRRTMLSAFHQENRFVAAATRKAIIMPALPPSANPTAMKRAVMKASSMAVLIVFIVVPRNGVSRAIVRQRKSFCCGENVLI